GWSFIDTLRFRSNGKWIWQVTLPLGHDSSLFVSVMAQIKNPSKDSASMEPARIFSHLSSGVLRVKPTPHLVLMQDTIIFGCYKIGDTCVTANLAIANYGEDSLHIGAINIPAGNFTVVPQQIDLGYYETRNIIIKYCPTKVGKDTTTMQFVSNEGVRVVILIGCGIDKDTRITFKPTSLNFGKLHVGKCDTLQFTARSIGKDSALFNPNNFSQPPFSIIQPTSPILLGQNDSIHVKIAFCPDDTGLFHRAFVLTEKRDSVVVSGVGTRTLRLLTADTLLAGKTLCVGICDTIRVHLHSLGNDTVTISNISGASLAIGSLPIRIPGQIDTTFLIRYCATQIADSTALISYGSDADSVVLPTTLKFHSVGLEFNFTHDIDFGSLCVSTSDSLELFVKNIGGDKLSIDGIHLLGGQPFSLLPDTAAANDSIRFFIRFTPQSSGAFRDTIELLVQSEVCSDSVLRIPVQGIAAPSSVSFSSASINFGTLDTGACKTDSVQITASCPITIVIPPVSAPFSIVSPSNGILIIPAGKSATITYQYCPKAPTADTLVSNFSSLPNGSFDLRLIGQAISLQDSPFVRFKLSKVIQTAGTTFDYLISVDSISASAKINSLQGTIRFDPTVVQPLDMNGISWSITKKGETIPGIYDFESSGSTVLSKGPFATLNFLGLYGAHDTTLVILDNIKVKDDAVAEEIPGYITLIHCGNLPGNIIIGGTYTLGDPLPNPATRKISLPVVLGNDGILRITLYSQTGMPALTRSFNSKRGINTIVLDVSELSSGIYYLSADSWGWRDGKKILIQK
ncbi:MAG: choice-of-anchor D domain-containing protein, partial [Ignavibacteriota bacterium]